MKIPRAQILELFDQGYTPRALIAAGFPKHHVYRTLQVARPTRQRAPKTCTSDMPALILRLFDEGIENPNRIATLCNIVPSYVYRVLQGAALTETR